MNEIDRVLGQIRAAQQTLGINKLNKSSKAEGVDFGNALQRSLEGVSNTQKLAQKLAQDFEIGANGVQLHDAMIAGQKANITFQAMVQIRNRVVAAYQEIMNMNV